MNPRAILVMILLLWGTAVNARAGGDASTDVRPLAERALQMLATERQVVEQAQFAERGHVSSADWLAAFGRSAAAAGQFGESAAAYAMFLSESGLKHAYSEQVLVRFGASLAPLDLDSVDILHTSDGPQYRPTWQMGKAASVEQLRLAVGVYEVLANVAKDKQESAKALLSLGWVHRALNDWNASTAAWDRAAETSKESVVGADALWHAADNLAWTGQPAEAAKRLRRLAAEHPQDARFRVIDDRIELLDAESRRTTKWFDNPITSLRKEIAERAAQRKPHEVYASAVQWLQARGNAATVITVSRWATTQADWPIQARLVAYLDLVDAILHQPKATGDAKLEAADVLAKVVSLSPGDDWAIPAAIRRSRLLSELTQFEAADGALADIKVRWQDNPRWEPSVLIERMQFLVDRGDLTEAKSLQEKLRSSYPEYELPSKLARTLAAVKNGGGR